MSRFHDYVYVFHNADLIGSYSRENPKPQARLEWRPRMAEQMAGLTVHWVGGDKRWRWKKTLMI